MDLLLHFFDAQRVAFVWLDYPFSWLEVVGVLFNLVSVWLLARNRVAGWPIGLVGVILFFFLFFQVRLYSDALEQVYYLLTGIYGWWVWSKTKIATDPTSGIGRLSAPQRLFWGSAFCIGTLGLGALMERIHIFLPQIFTQPADFPFLDAGTTIAGFIGNFLMATRKIECWPIWVMVNIFCIYIYASKSMLAMTALYAVFLVFAIKGMYLWSKMLQGRPVRIFP